MNRVRKLLARFITWLRGPALPERSEVEEDW